MDTLTFTMIIITSTVLSVFVMIGSVGFDLVQIHSMKIG